MRGLKFVEVYKQADLLCVASFAYDAWIEMCKNRARIVQKLVASFAYDAWIEMAIHRKQRSLFCVASFAYDAWIEITFA